MTQPVLYLETLDLAVVVLMSISVFLLPYDVRKNSFACVTATQTNDHTAME
jgi:hypothetical protein